MKNKKNWNVLLFPHPLSVILLSLLSALLLYVVFSRNLENTILAYVTYPLSAYSLTILIALISKLVISKKPWTYLASTKIGTFLLDDKERRFFIFFALSIPFNFIYSVFKIGYGSYIHSVWMIENGILYILIMAMRPSLVLSRRNGKEERAVLISGIILTLTSPLYTVLLYRMVFLSSSPIYKGNIIYAAALYSSIKVYSAVSGLIRDRKTNSPSVLSAKILKTELALVSIIFLEGGMLKVFGEGNKEEAMLFLVSGTAVAALLLAGGILMIRLSTRNRTRQ